MKSIIKLSLCIFLSVLIFLALPSQVNAAPLFANPESQTYSDKVVFGDTFVLGSGEVLDGNLTILGGTVTLEANSRVTGNVVLLGGTLNVNGNILGNLNTLGGSLFLESQAVIDGNLSMIGGSLHRDSQAQVLGQTLNGGINPFNFNLPDLPFTYNPFSGFQPIFNLFSTFINIIIMAALAILVVLIWPRPSERVAHAVGSQPLITGGLGLLTAIVLPALLIVLLVTIILIPASFLGFLVLGVAVLFGWFAVGLEVGKRIAELFKQTWQPALSAGIGTLAITFIASFIGSVPCVGWLVPFLIAVVGLGGVVITRFGSQTYPTSNQISSPVGGVPATPPPPAPSSTPEPPTPPASSTDDQEAVDSTNHPSDEDINTNPDDSSL